MQHPDRSPTSTVVCRELASPSKYSQLRKKPVFFCNHPCDIHFPHSVCDAARATSAAPTFFPVVKLERRCFVDGGMEYNNPSFAIQNHYGKDNRVRSSKTPRPQSSPSPSPASRHGNLDISRVRYINIGTGTKTDSVPERKRDVLARLVPSFIRTALFLKETLLQIAVDSEKTADNMRVLQEVSHGDILYDRFSAGNGVCFFKLDRWADLDKIESLTEKYLAEDAAALQAVADEIAIEYVELRRAGAAHTDPVSSPARSAEHVIRSARTGRVMATPRMSGLTERQTSESNTTPLPSVETETVAEADETHYTPIAHTDATDIPTRPIGATGLPAAPEPNNMFPEASSSTETQQFEHHKPPLPNEESEDSANTATTRQTIDTGASSMSRESTPPSDMEEAGQFSHKDPESDTATSTAQTTPSKFGTTQTSSHIYPDSGTAATFQAAVPNTVTSIACS